MEVLKDEVKLVVKDLYKNYDNEDVLKRISFEVKKGEFLSVLGPSGCGKTTLIESIVFDENKLLCLPRTENNKMEFYYINSDEDFFEQTEVGQYGITVPKSNQEKFDINNIPDKTLIIVPGLAFDEQGNRLGKGKGYYDKFLAELFSTSEKEKILGVVGYCYDFQIIDKVITEQNDFPVDYIISDKRIVKISKGNK